jgi:hypothetical protein
MSKLRKLIVQRRRVAEFEVIVRELGDAFHLLYALPDNRRNGQAIVMNLENTHTTARALDEAIQELNSQRQTVRAAGERGNRGALAEVGRE